MHSGTSTFISALTTALESFTTMLMTGIFNFWKYGFCELNSEQEIIGLNLLGSIVIILFSLSLLGAFLIWFIETATPWHHEENKVELNEDLENTPNAVDTTIYSVGNYTYSRAEYNKALAKYENRKKIQALNKHFKYEDRLSQYYKKVGMKGSKYKKYEEIMKYNLFE